MNTADEIRIMVWMYALELAAGIDRAYWATQIELLLGYRVPGTPN